jgi:hypothetical protein
MITTPTITVVEPDPSELVKCPFCGCETYPGDKSEEWAFDPQTCVCEHTLFVATDDGFEYRSKRFNEHMGLPDNQESEPGLPDDIDGGYDGFTSNVRIPGAVKYACYTPAPGCLGAYFGFTPLTLPTA